jgi:radical SAM protein with 4Fe4S-binding SPASM domain
LEEEEKYVPINKGHFDDLETPERMAEFSRKLGEGWEDEYKIYRENWSEAPKRKEVLEYPILVDLELSSKCNLLCPMCPTITDEFRSHTKKTNIDTDLAKKVIDEIAGKVNALRLSWVGEPTLHRDLVEIIKYAKDKGIRETSFLTNGSKLELDYFIKLQEAGIDWITISVDGTDERYNAIRKPLKFEDTLRKIRDIKEYKTKNGLSKPVIKIQSVWPAMRENAEEFYNLFSPLVDVVAYNPLIDYLHKDEDIVYEENFSCPQYYQRVTVSATGEVAMCSNDDEVREVIGDATKESIHDIWHGEKLNRLRDIHSKKDGFKSIDACRLCYYPRKAIPDEMVFVNGREIWIENYVNRKQEVGE